MQPKLTPMLQQYKKIKKGIPAGVILMFRLGDFYEMFFEDAVIASRVLNITLTSRSKEAGKNYPMCGIPYHAAETYIRKLIKAGHKVAVCDQVEDPKLVKGIVKREVTRMITPGTVLDSQLLEDGNNNFIIAANRIGGVYGLSFLDLSTGEFKVTEFNKEQDFVSEFSRIAPRECVLPESFKETKILLDKISRNGDMLTNFYEDWIFDYEMSYAALKDHFKTQSLDGFGCQGLVPGVTAAGAIFHYLRENLHKSLGHIQSIVPYSTNDYMVLDAATIRNLELVAPLRSGNKQTTLLGVLDVTVTSMGARLLRNWIKQPLINLNNVKARQSGVKELNAKRHILDELRMVLKDIPDMERLIGRVDSGYANPRDLVALKQGLNNIPKLKLLLESAESSMLSQLCNDLVELPKVVLLLERALISEPPAIVRDGGFIKDDFNSELDDLRQIARQGKGWLSNFQVKESERTGIRSLKVKYNKVFGYYIEVSKTNLAAVPGDYIRKQTLVNAERFITPDLKEYETKILNSEEHSNELECKIFNDIRQEVARETAVIQKIGIAVAVLDVLACLAEVALRNNYVFPEITDSYQIDISEGRHPVLDRFLEEGKRFVPNDTILDGAEDQLIIITGPNMAGKSTYIRQVALLTLMAQIGSGIPAKKATIGVVDRIFTRVGASDEISRGQSTFMVEMNETAYILNNATEKSLIILDEIGRGTSTFDGISIAWAVAEFLVRKRKEENTAGPKTLFATHYHELTELTNICNGVKNYNIAVREWNDEIVFLYKIVPGGTDKSYGIHVARLAGLPYSVLERAKKILTKLEEGNLSASGGSKLADVSLSSSGDQSRQMYLFSSAGDQLFDELKKLNLDYLTPIEALNKLREIKERLNS